MCVLFLCFFFLFTVYTFYAAEVLETYFCAFIAVALKARTFPEDKK